MNMTWKVVSEEYLNYLRAFEHRIPYSDYGDNKYKPFFGTLFERNGLTYITTISHPQFPRHQKLKQQLDFYKVYHPKNNRLLAVVNLKFMFPVPSNLLSDLKYSEIEQVRNFKNSDDKSKYINLLKTELSQLNLLGLEEASQKLYDNKYNNPNSNVAKRCLDFEFLEIKSKEFIFEEK